MSNRFKDYHEKLKSNKTVILSDDEMDIYSKTSGNMGVSHSHPEWDDQKASDEELDRDGFDSKKNKTILRNLERETKNRIGEEVAGVMTT